MTRLIIQYTVVPSDLTCVVPVKVPPHILQDYLGWIHVAESVYGGSIVLISSVETVIPESFHTFCWIHVAGSNIFLIRRKRVSH